MKHHFIISEFFNAYDELTPTHVMRDLYLWRTKVTALGNLEYVGGDLIIERTKITSLGNLQNVDGYLFLRETKVTSLGKLKNVIGAIFCSDGEQYNKLETENKRKFVILEKP